MGSVIKSCVVFVALSALPWLARGDGIVILDLDGNSYDSGSSLASTIDGRLYLTAWTRTTTSRNQYILAFDAAGQAVSTFGTNGRVITHDVGSCCDTAQIAVRSDGAVVTVGSNFVDASDVLIHSPDGALQSQLHLPQLHLPSTEILSVLATSVAVQSDDFSVVGGYLASRGALTAPEWTLVRVRPDGLLDTTFGGGTGWIRRKLDTSPNIEEVRIQPDGKILATGFGCSFGCPDSLTVIGRFNSDGTTDVAFGTDGLITLPCAFLCGQLALDSVGRIYVDGEDRLLMRLNADGSPDTRYASVAVDSDISIRDFAVDSADRVVVFGRQSQMAYLARFLPSGARDRSFGSGGEVRIQLPAELAVGEMVPGMVPGIVLPNDKPVALLSISGNNNDIGLVQLTEAGALDVSFGANDVVPDAMPDHFAFVDNTAPFGTTSVVSDTVTIGGINTRTSVDIGCTPGYEIWPHGGCQDDVWNGAFSIGCTGTFVTAGGTLLPGDTLCLRHSSNPQPGGRAQTSVSVGGRLVTYITVSTSEAADTQPDNFAFVDQSGVAPGATVTSNVITITGLTGAAPVAIDGGSYSVGCDPQRFATSNGSITNGQTICVSHVASSQRSAAVNTTLVVGGVTDTFTSTSAPPDPPPPATTPPSSGGGGGTLSLKDVAALLLLLLAALRKSSYRGGHPSAPVTAPTGHPVSHGSGWRAASGFLPKKPLRGKKSLSDDPSGWGGVSLQCLNPPPLA